MKVLTMIYIKLSVTRVSCRLVALAFGTTGAEPAVGQSGMQLGILKGLIWLIVEHYWLGTSWASN